MSTLTATTTPRLAPRTFWTGIVALLLVTVALRTAALEAVPPGLTHDEAANGHDAAAILSGDLRLYFSVGYGREPLYQYSVAAVTALLGQSIFTLRVTSVGWSLLTWSLTVALARRWWGQRAALVVGLAMTASFWTLMVARVGLRATTLPPLFTAAILAYDHAMVGPAKRPAWHAYVAAGFLMGLCFYTYMASRGLPAVFIALVTWMAVRNRPAFRTTGPGTLLLLLTAALTGTPLYLHLRAHPELEYRLTQLSGPLQALGAGDWGPVWHNVARSLPMLGWRGDPLWLYNVGQRPALAPFLVLLFWTGVVAALLRLRDRRNAMVLLWLGAGLTPALITGPEFTVLRAIAAQPAVFLLIGLGVERAARWALLRRRSRTLRTGLGFLLVGGMLITGVGTADAYFRRWGQDPDVRGLYLHHVVALGRHLDAAPASSPAVISSLYPGRFHDPYTVEVTARRDDLALRWADGQHALFVPAVAESRLYTNTQAALHPLLAASLRPYLTPATTLSFQPDDFIPAVHGYRWRAAETWVALSGTLAADVQAAPGDPPPAAPHITLRAPLTLAENVTLAGYRIAEPAPGPGGRLTVLTAWKVARPYPAELVLFTHLLDAAGNLVTQQDRLDAPAWQWGAGDRFVQVHTLNLDATLPPGAYALAVGFYTRADMTRLPLTHPQVTDPPATRLLIPVEIAAP